MIRRIIFLSILLLIGTGAAIASRNDSLLRVLDQSEDDSLKVQTLLTLAATYYRSEPPKAIDYATQARSLAEEIGYPRGMAYACKGIGMGYYMQGDYVDALLHWEASLEKFRSINDLLGVSNMLNNLGAVFYNEGENDKALENYLQSLHFSEQIGDSLRIATALVNIGAIYQSKEATEEMALDYYSRALLISEALGDDDAIGTSTVNLGQIYFSREDDISALFYFTKALNAYRNSETGNVSYAMQSIGQIYAFRGEYQKAIDYQQEAYELAKKNGNKLEMAQSLLSLASTYNDLGDLQGSIKTYKSSSEIAAEIRANYVLQDSYSGLANTYAKMPDYKNAYKYQALYNDIKDTLYNAALDKRIQVLNSDYEVKKIQHQIDLLTADQDLKDLAIKRQKLQRNAYAITGGLMLLLALGMLNRFYYVRKTKRIIEYEKDRSEELLLNIIPAEMAEELKERGSATPKHYEMVTVMFTDFKGFSRIAEQLSPEELVAELDFYFHAFDKIIDKHKIEKIKTIGDAYMCAGGIPVANTTNPSDVVKAGLEIKEFMEKKNFEKKARGEDCWELRIGIHTGPVIAGVVGKNKFAYDIWGDAVNIASRAESNGIPGKVNISGCTYQLIKNEYKCSFRGQIQAKNKGGIDMYIVEGCFDPLIDTEDILALEELDSKLHHN